MIILPVYVMAKFCPLLPPLRDPTHRSPSTWGVSLCWPSTNSMGETYATTRWACAIQETKIPDMENHPLPAGGRLYLFEQHNGNGGSTCGVRIYVYHFLHPFLKISLRVNDLVAYTAFHIPNGTHLWGSESVMAAYFFQKEQTDTYIGVCIEHLNKTVGHYRSENKWQLPCNTDSSTAGTPLHIEENSLLLIYLKQTLVRIWEAHTKSIIKVGGSWGFASTFIRKMYRITRMGLMSLLFGWNTLAKPFFLNYLEISGKKRSNFLHVSPRTCSTVLFMLACSLLFLLLEMSDRLGLTTYHQDCSG